MSEEFDHLREKVRAVRAEFEDALRHAKDSSALSGLRDRFLGR